MRKGVLKGLIERLDRTRSQHTCLQVLHGDSPYELIIHGVKGITEEQRDLLKALGAIEEAE
jgi:hypothetical protein